MKLRFTSLIITAVLFSLFITMYLTSANFVQAANNFSALFNFNASQYASKSGPGGLPQGSSARTVEAWVKTNSANEATVFFYGTDAGNFHQWAVQLANNMLGVRVNGGNIFWNATGINDGNWHHIAVVYAGNGDLDTQTVAYMDAAPLTQASSVNVTPDTTLEAVSIGASISSPIGSFFNGQIDEVRLWSSSRSQAEIISAYNQELSGTEAGLVGYWKLNGDFVDESANANNLINTNGAQFSNNVPFPITPPGPPFQIRKSANESVNALVTLQNDDHLAVRVEAGKTYIVEGAIFAVSPSATPDIRIAFEVPSGSDMSIGHISAAGSAVDGGLLETSEASSIRIQLPANTPVPIMIQGTVVAGASGVLQLKWAQWASNQNVVTVKKGSYLSVQEI